jgi:hypothetical protein
MTSIASQMVKSGYFSDVRDVSMAIVKIQAGKELGIPPFAAMTGIHIIQNKPVLGSNVIATLVKNDPRYDYHIKQADDKACILEWYEDGKRVGEAGFTIAEAQGAGLTGKDNWKKYTSDMLFARAISRGARRFAPGIFGGSPVYTPDEMGVDTDEDGYIEAQVVTIEKPVDEKPAVEYQAEPMTIEKACTIQNSDGIPYHELAVEKLSHMFNAIEGALEKPDLTDEKKAEYLEKQSAIKVLIAAKNEGSI